MATDALGAFADRASSPYSPPTDAGASTATTTSRVTPGPTRLTPELSSDQPATPTGSSFSGSTPGPTGDSAAAAAAAGAKLPRPSRPCDHCRRRKTRCVKPEDGPCDLCRRTNTPCTFVNRPEKRKRPPPSSEPRPAKSAARANAASSSSLNMPGTPGFPSLGPVAAARKTNSSASADPHGRNSTLSLPGRIEVPPMRPSDVPPEEECDPPLVPVEYDLVTLVGLSGDQDPHLLQYYDYDDRETYAFIKHAIRRVSANEALPVQFLAYNDDRSKKDLNAAVEAQRKRLQQLSGKFEERLLALYFRFIYPSYPVVDKEIFYHDYYYNKEGIGPGLLAGLLALATIWWKYDAVLCVHTMPPNLGSQLFKECAIAVDRDARHPTLSTVQALLLLLQKRLMTDQTAETYATSVDLSRLVAIAHNLGLHIDCSDWTIPPSVKRLRRKLWAHVYIIEKWTSANIGIPSLLHDENTTNPLFDSSDPADAQFVYMGRLTAILDRVVHSFYSVHGRDTEYYEVEAAQKRVDRFFEVLNDWRRSLPEDLSDMQCSAPGEFCKNGTLHLAALTVEILLFRIRLRPIAFKLPQYKQYRAEALECIQRVARFTSEITHSHLHAFWHATSRLCFSTIAHFVFYHHMTSTTASEYKETHELLRKWLWALRVLSQGWEEGTGLAAFRVDTVFSLGKSLFAPPKESKDEEQPEEAELATGKTTGQQPGEQPADDAVESAESAPEISAEPIPEDTRATVSDSGEMGPGMTNVEAAPSMPDEYRRRHSHDGHFGHETFAHHVQDVHHGQPGHHGHHDIHHPVHNGNGHNANHDDEEFTAEGFAASWFQPAIDLAHNPPQLDLDDTDLLLHEDIMPQEKQIEYLGDNPAPEDDAGQYDEFFAEDRLPTHDDILLTEELHDILTADIDNFEMPMGPMWRPIPNHPS